MGTYFNPADDLPKVGRRLEGQSFKELTAQLRHGEKLYGLYDRLIYKFAARLSDEGEFEAAEQMYRSGNAVSHAFYALDEKLETND